MIPLSHKGDSPLGADPLARWRVVVGAFLLMAAVLFLGIRPVQALSAADFPPNPPANHVLDEAHVLPRATSLELERNLQSFTEERVDATVITVGKLDYGLSLEQLGENLLKRWSSPSEEQARLLLLVDAQTRATAVVASEGLSGRLPGDLLTSTAETTMALPLRSADRYRQATLDALSRLATVLRGGEDPGEPVVGEAPTVVSNIPSKEETQNSNAFTWVVVLLVVGTVVPMATWWVFSR